MLIEKLREIVEVTKHWQQGMSGAEGIVSFSGDDITLVCETNPERAEMIVTALRALPALLDVVESSQVFKVANDHMKQAMRDGVYNLGVLADAQNEALSALFVALAKVQ